MRKLLKNNKKSILGMSVLILLGVLTRTLFHLGVNIEFVTGISLLSGYVFKNRLKSLIVPLLIMLISDLIIGNSIIFVFTWSAFLAVPLFSQVLETIKPKNELKTVLAAQFLGILSSIFFFLWTNFGVVVTTQMYTRNFQGLIQSYINALPFLRNQLFGNLILIPLIFSVYFILKKISILILHNQLGDIRKLSQI
jgi:hypothetical protein